MTENNCITEKRTFKQLTDIQRGMLEQMAKSGTYTQAEMARELGVSQPTVSRELKRGRTRQLDYKHNYYEQYMPPQVHGFIKKTVRTRMRGIIINILRLSLLPYQKI